jgi:hypothetical protein
VQKLWAVRSQTGPRRLANSLTICSEAR